MVLVEESHVYIELIISLETVKTTIIHYSPEKVPAYTRTSMQIKISKIFKTDAMNPLNSLFLPAS